MDIEELSEAGLQLDALLLGASPPSTLIRLALDTLSATLLSFRSWWPAGPGTWLALVVGCACSSKRSCKNEGCGEGVGKGGTEKDLSPGGWTGVQQGAVVAVVVVRAWRGEGSALCWTAGRGRVQSRPGSLRFSVDFRFRFRFPCKSIKSK